MNGDPLNVFLSLLTVCVRDDEEGGSRLGQAAFTFVMGMVASGITAYVLGLAHLAF